MLINTLENNVHKLDSKIYDITYIIQSKLAEKDYTKLADYEAVVSVLGTVKNYLKDIYSYIEEFQETKDSFYKKLATDTYFNLRKLVIIIYTKLLSGPAKNPICVAKKLDIA